MKSNQSNEKEDHPISFTTCKRREYVPTPLLLIPPLLTPPLFTPPLTPRPVNYTSAINTTITYTLVSHTPVINTPVTHTPVNHTVIHTPANRTSCQLHPCYSRHRYPHPCYPANAAVLRPCLRGRSYLDHCLINLLFNSLKNVKNNSRKGSSSSPDHFLRFLIQF